MLERRAAEEKREGDELVVEAWEWNEIPGRCVERKSAFQVDGRADENEIGEDSEEGKRKGGGRRR